jgi:hypothetical protein
MAVGPSSWRQESLSHLLLRSRGNQDAHPSRIYLLLDCLCQRQLLQFPGRCCFPLSNRGTAFSSSKERNGPALIPAFKCFLYLPGDGLREIFFAVVDSELALDIPRGLFAVFFLVIGILVCSQSGDPP